MGQENRRDRHGRRTPASKGRKRLGEHQSWPRRRCSSGGDGVQARQQLIAGLAFDDPIADAVQILEGRQASQSVCKLIRRATAELQCRLAAKPVALIRTTQLASLRKADSCASARRFASYRAQRACRAVAISCSSCSSSSKDGKAASAPILSTHDAFAQAYSACRNARSAGPGERRASASRRDGSSSGVALLCSRTVATTRLFSGQSCSAPLPVSMRR